MAVVRLPAILAREAGGEARFETDAATLRGALHALPVADLLFDARGELRPLVNVYVDGDDARAALDAPLASDAEVRVIAAVAGGSVHPASYAGDQCSKANTSAVASPSSSARSR